MEPKATAAITVLPEVKPARTEQPPAKVESAPEVADARAAAQDKARQHRSQPDQADTRLVIDVDEASGSYVYKTINRTTGEILSQLPRAEILKLKDGGAYEAGSVIRTKA